MPVTITEPKDETPRHEVIYEHGERRTGEERTQPRKEEQVGIATLTGGSTLELIGGGVAVVLTIIGLSGYLPLYMCAIATIAIGVGLLAVGAASTVRKSEILRQSSPRAERVEAGIGSEMFGGACGIVLGILSLAGVVPLVLLPVAAIVLGGSILIAAPSEPDVARQFPDADPRVGRMTYAAVETSSGAMMLAGAASIVLGILALIRIGPVYTLSMVAMLVLGGALFLTGSALTARFARRLQHVAA